MLTAEEKGIIKPLLAVSLNTTVMKIEDGPDGRSYQLYADFHHPFWEFKVSSHRFEGDKFKSLQKNRPYKVKDLIV